MKMIKNEARLNVRLDFENNKIVLIVKEDSGYESKVLFNADVAYSVGHTLEAYALILKQSNAEEKTK